MPIWVIAIIILAAIVAAIVVAVWQQKRLRTNLRLEISNQGNARSRYDLWAQDPDGILEFRFTLDGDSLPEGTIVKDDPAADRAPVAQPAPSAPSAAPSQPAQVQQRAKQAAGLGGAIAGMLGSLGMILPRSLGSPLLKAAGELRRGQYRVRQVEQLPGRASGQARRVRVKVPSAPPSSAPPAAPTFVPEAGQPAGSWMLSPVRAWVQTPSVEPGESLRFDLLVKPVKPTKSQLYTFTVLSRSAEQEDAPEATEEWTVKISGVAGFRQYLPYLLIVVLTILTLLLASWLANIGS